MTSRLWKKAFNHRNWQVEGDTATSKAVQLKQTDGMNEVEAGEAILIDVVPTLKVFVVVVGGTAGYLYYRCSTKSQGPQGSALKR